MAEILVVDDDPKICSLVRRLLVLDGHRVTTASSGEEALRLAAVSWPDLVVLDVLMPGLDGWEVCRRLREAGDCSVIFLTARDEVRDRVRGLELGADDYLVKPFAAEELVARVRARLRRRSAENLRFADLTLNVETREVKRGNRRLNLTPREFDLLRCFLENPRRVFTREQLLNAVWGVDYEGESNVIDVYVGYLRQKLEAAAETRLIHTVRGVGYTLREDEA